MVVKVIDTLLGGGDGAVILFVAVDSPEWGVHCSAAQDKEQVRIIT